MSHKNKQTGKLEALLAAGPIELPAAGTSMGARFPEGVVFRIEVLTARRPLPGTLLVWENAQGVLVIHRLLIAVNRKGAYRFYAKGDALGKVDPSILPDRQMVGFATHVLYPDGRELDLTRGRATFCGLCIALLALPGALRRAWKTHRALQRRRNGVTRSK